MELASMGLGVLMGFGLAVLILGALAWSEQGSRKAREWQAGVYRENYRKGEMPK